jgi:transglutaminase-like putative cysteine protease
VLGALIILFNLSNLPDSYYLYFVLYFFAAMLLIAVTRMSAQSSGLTQTANYSMGSLVYLGVSLLCITALAASISWITPQAHATGLQDWIATSMPWQNDLLDSRVNIFNVVPSKQALTTASTLKDLYFGETWNQGDDIKFIVLSERPSYWRMNVYDTYSSKGWSSNPFSKILQNADIPWTNSENLSNREQMKYAVVNGIRTDVLFTNGGFISADITVWLNLDAKREITSITAPRILDPGERYTVTSYVSTATESDLVQADGSYPVPILTEYLQLPDDFSDGIKRLSENITTNSTTPYAKVKAVIGYLAQFPYTLKIEAPPEGADSVEYFLFTRKSGFCLHFASAAVVMLRSVGVPARLAIGYLPGDPGKTAGQYIIRDKYFHAWPQVYFAGYGWVDIEATPGGASSPVAISSPWISSPTLEESAQWDVWQGTIPPPMLGIPNINLENIMKGGARDTGSSSFPASLGRVLLFVFGGILIIALLIGAIVVMRSLSFHWLWRVNRSTLSYDTYINMCRLAATVGIIPRPQQTPLEFTTELVAVIPQQVKEVNFITRLYMDYRFGGRDSKPEMADEAEILKARHVVYRQLIQRLGKVRRLFVLGKR